MKVTHLALLGTLCLAACGGSDMAEQRVTAGASQSGIPLQTYFVTHDFGTVDVEERVSGSLELVNEGKTTIEFESSRTSCGCLAVKSMPRRIAPGELGIFELIFDAPHQLGRFDSRAMFWDGEPKTLLVLAETTAVVRGIGTFPDHIAFGKIRIHDRIQKELFVVAAGYPGAETMSAKIDCPWLSLLPQDADSSRVPKKVGAKVISSHEIRYDGQQVVPGPFSTTAVVMVKTARDDNELTFKVPVTGHVLGSVNVVPSQVVFGPIGDDPVRRVCAIVFEEDSPHITNIACFTGHANVTAQIQKDPSAPRKWTLLAEARPANEVTEKLIQGCIRGEDIDGRIVFSIPFTGLLLE